MEMDGNGWMDGLYHNLKIYSKRKIDKFNFVFVLLFTFSLKIIFRFEQRLSKGVRYLKDGNDGPEESVEVLATAVLGTNESRITELAAEQMHPENAKHITFWFITLWIQGLFLHAA